MKPLSMTIREILRQHDDGLTVGEISKIMQKRPTLVRGALHRMPDTYIDRWQPGTTKWVSVWCLHLPPPNAPMPEGSIYA